MRIDFVIAADRSGVQPQPREERFPLLEKLIARGDPWPLDGAHDFSSCLATLFELPPAPMPVAALGLLAEGVEPDTGPWVRLDPVHLRAERSHVRLLPLPQDALTQAEAHEFAGALAAHCEAEGMELRALRPQQWYLRCPGRQAPASRCPRRSAGVLGQDHLPGGPDGAFWRRLMTEAQMLLHDAPLNEAREAQGKLAVNAVWPWGGGSIPFIPAHPYRFVYARAPFARGLGLASGAGAAPLPHDASGMMKAPGPVLLALELGVEWSLRHIEQTWLEVAAQALAQGGCEELRLALVFSTRMTARRLTRRHLRRWWRRPSPIALHA